ncbi:putative methanogenesis regulatory protein FilR2 [uncultured archaeon]|nr:putative methanogenesis regulatory protein FilR2 [uncultured archaeon]
MDGTPKIVLVVEDDKFLSTILKTRLEREGYSVFTAANGEEALAIIRKQSPALVVLDLVMPKMSGFEFLEQMSMDPQLHGIPVVVASQLGQESDIAKAKSMGVVDYFIKAETPIDQLIQNFKNIIENHDTSGTIKTA